MDAIQVDGGITSEASNWVFDEHVAPHFDEHVRKSVPEYARVQELAATSSDWLTHNGSTVLDFGASTGETIRRIRERHSKTLDLIGFDNSQAMIEQAAKNAVREYARTRIPNKPRKITGSLVLAAAPRIVIVSGVYRASCVVKLRIDETTPYRAF